VTQAVMYATDKGIYPTSILAIRDAGLANVSDTDPWGPPTRSPRRLPGFGAWARRRFVRLQQGPRRHGDLPQPFASNTGNGGSVGYSSVYGSWTGT
jgi:hypothetical protein